MKLNVSAFYTPSTFYYVVWVEQRTRKSFLLLTCLPILLHFNPCFVIVHENKPRKYEGYFSWHFSFFFVGSALALIKLNFIIVLETIWTVWFFRNSRSWCLKKLLEYCEYFCMCRKFSLFKNGTICENCLNVEHMFVQSIYYFLNFFPS